jgi:hypothetical protein
MLQDTFNDVRQSFNNQWPWYVVATGVLVILVWVIAISRLRKSKRHDEIQDDQGGWMPTGRIDFLNPQSMGNFILQAEDTRIIDGVGGVEHREIRWRKATLDEAKTVVVAYHVQRNLTMTAHLTVNSPLRRASNLTNNEPQKTKSELDDVPDGKSEA